MSAEAFAEKEKADYENILKQLGKAVPAAVAGAGAVAAEEVAEAEEAVEAEVAQEADAVQEVVEETEGGQE